MAEPLSITIFSDVICPWCFLGYRRLESALDQLGLAGRTAIRWLPFELNPDMPPEGMERAVYRAGKFGADRAAALDRDMRKLGAQEGVRFAFDRMERTPNTRKAHLLIAHAAQQGLGTAAAKALFSAYFEEARDIGRDQVLVEIGNGIGLDGRGVQAALNDESRRAAIIDVEQEAIRLGISGVPVFVMADAWAVSGAQPPEAWVDILRGIPDLPLKVPIE